MQIDVFFKWWKTWRTLPVMAWIKAASLYRVGEYALAEKYYLKGLEQNPEHPARYSARMDLAYCLFKNRKIAEAEEQLRYVATHAPQTREAHLRLARLQTWAGQSLDAAWTIRRALRKIPADAELVALFLLAVLDNGGPAYLLREAVAASKSFNTDERKHPLLEVALAKLAMFKGEEKGRDDLARLAAQMNAPFEAVLALGEILLQEGRVAEARQELKRAMVVTPDHPRLLSLLAESYLSDGLFYQPEYGRQLAVNACQHTNWSSPREMHILAEAFYRLGDKISALVVASKAKQAGSRLLGTYQGVKNLDKLIETLSAGTQA